VDFRSELISVLPNELPNRALVIEKSSQLLSQIREVNQYMNLTRISDAREAAIKHVLDSVAPWELFQGAKRILDAGTGAGFPGIPLSLVLPDVEFVLSESIQKKARFVASVTESLDLPNVEVLAERAESVADGRRPQIITARAVAPLHRLVELFANALKNGAQLLVYKGPDVEAEIAEISAREATAKVVFRYDLPEGMGSRTMVSVSGNSHKRASTMRQ
jgi:16S rRNA (guanine527-N7)-methyltransferase